MRRKLKERLKDIIIDYIYHYCYNEVVKKIEGKTIKITLPEGSSTQDDPVLKSLIDYMMIPPTSVKMFHDVRNEAYCKLIEGDVVHKSFMDNLLSQGYKKSDKLSSHIEGTLNFLVNRSYLSRNLPVKTEYKLTPKGINHYNTGRSFEDIYIKGRHAFLGLIISIISIVIAVFALFINFILQHPF